MPNGEPDGGAKRFRADRGVVLHAPARHERDRPVDDRSTRSAFHAGQCERSGAGGHRSLDLRVRVTIEALAPPTFSGTTPTDMMFSERIRQRHDRRLATLGWPASRCETTTAAPRSCLPSLTSYLNLGPCRFLMRCGHKWRQVVERLKSGRAWRATQRVAWMVSVIATILSALSCQRARASHPLAQCSR